MSDINLVYSGGSGGFLLLHLLLLSGRYTVSLDNNADIETAISQQWQVDGLPQWKKYEYWPNNQQTQKLKTQLRKIYFGHNRSWPVSGAKLATVYTDYASLRLLSYHKRAYWYAGQLTPAFDLKFSHYRRLLRTWRLHYNNIRDPSWPRCVSFRHINRMPQHIQQELLSDPHTAYFLNQPKFEEDITEFNGMVMYGPAAEFVKSASIAVKLQDLVNSDGQVLVDAFDIPPISARQRQLIAHWRSLHPPDLLDSVGIKHNPATK